MKSIYWHVARRRVRTYWTSQYLHPYKISLVALCTYEWDVSTHQKPILPGYELILILSFTCMWSSRKVLYQIWKSYYFKSSDLKIYIYKHIHTYIYIVRVPIAMMLNSFTYIRIYIYLFLILTGEHIGLLSYILTCMHSDIICMSIKNVLIA